MCSINETYKNQSYLEGHGNKHKSTETYWTKATTRHCRTERFRFAGHILRMAPERPAHSAIDWTTADGRKKAGQGRPGGQHFVMIYIQEESAGARWRN